MFYIVDFFPSYAGLDMNGSDDAAVYSTITD